MPPPGREAARSTVRTRVTLRRPWRTIVTGAADLADLAGIYRDLHAHPELSFAEHRTAGVVAARLRDLGYQTTTGVGRTGVVGVRPTATARPCWSGPTWTRCRCSSGTAWTTRPPSVPQARTAKMTGHARVRPRRARYLPAQRRRLVAGDTSDWSGTLLLVFQPAERSGRERRP